MKRHLFFIVLICLFFSISILAQSAESVPKEHFAMPFDEANKDPSFKTFRTNLIRTLQNKNKRLLYNVLDKNIQLSFGGDAGIEDFKRLWKINKSNDVWEELLTVMQNGGKFLGGDGAKTFCAPYLFTAFPEGIDEFENQAIFGSNVNLREKPNLTANIITQLSYNIVKVDYINSVTSTTDKNDYIWFKINTLGGKTGFVAAKFVRSPIAHRACFQKKLGVWKMTAFIAGRLNARKKHYKI